MRLMKTLRAHSVRSQRVYETSEDFGVLRVKRVRRVRTLQGKLFQMLSSCRSQKSGPMLCFLVLGSQSFRDRMQIRESTALSGVRENLICPKAEIPQASQDFTAYVRFPVPIS